MIYRKGAAGALLDIYERAILEFVKVIEDVPDSALTIITDSETSDENCRSVQSILTHVVNSGYGYATSIYNLKGYSYKRPDKVRHLTVRQYIEDLGQVLAYSETIFKDLRDDELEAFENAQKMKTVWGQWYDIEQLAEHAIIHILRHKRQIERIKESGILWNI